MGTTSFLSMSCSTIRQKLSAFADGEGSPAERATIATHLAGCPDCRQALADLDHLWQALEEGILPRPRPDFSQAVLRQITVQSKPGILDWIRSLAPEFPAPAALAPLIVLGLLAGGWMGRTVMEEPPMVAVTSEQASTLEAMDVFTPTPKGSLVQGYLVVLSDAQGVHQ